MHINRAQGEHVSGRHRSIIIHTGDITEKLRRAVEKDNRISLARHFCKDPFLQRE